MTRLVRDLYFYLAIGGGWIPFAMLVITIPITAVCVFQLTARYAFVHDNPQTQGVIKRFACPRRASGCDAVIGFDVNGVEQELTVQKNATPSFRSGHVVAVAYRIDSSSNISAKLVESPVHPGFFVALSIVTLIQAFVVWAIHNTFFVFRRSPQAQRLMRRRTVRPKRSIARTSPGKPSAASHGKSQTSAAPSHRKTP